MAIATLPLICLLALTIGDAEMRPALALVAKAAPAPKPCAAPEHRQFDFWLGEWDVTEKRKAAGTNRITRILDGCAVREEWAGASGTHGTSLNMWDAAARRWRQTWVDDKGNVLLLTGGRKGNRMLLEGEAPGDGGARLRHRITWSPLPGGHVRQLWDSTKDGGKTWEVVFDGDYAPRTR